MADLTLNDVTFLIDTREQTPWDFSILNDPKKKIRVKQRRATLKTGDYTIEGFPEIVVERKSLNDLLGCIGQSRERFEAELKRMLLIPHRSVVVERSWSELRRGEWLSQITPSQACGSVIGWRLWGVDFHFAENETLACRDAAQWMFVAARRLHRERTLQA